MIPQTIYQSNNCLIYFDIKDRANYFLDIVTIKFKDIYIRNTIYHQQNNIIIIKDNKEMQIELKAIKYKG